MEEARKRECIFAFFGLAIVDAVATIVIGISLHGDEGILIPIFIGFFCGQAGAIIVWSVCGPLRSYYRAPVGVLLTSLFVLIVGSPLFLTLYLESGLREAGFFLPIPFFVLVLLFCIWWAKNAFGWRFENNQDRQRFTIIDLIVAISTVGFCLALVRIGLKRSSALNSLSTVVLFIGCVAWTLILVLPIIRAAFFMNGEKRERFLIGFSSIVLFGLFMLPVFMSGNPASALPASMMFCFCHGILLVTFYLCLRFLRNCEIIVPHIESKKMAKT